MSYRQPVDKILNRRDKWYELKLVCGHVVTVISPHQNEPKFATCNQCTRR